MSEKFIYGMLRFEDSNKLWKRDRFDSDVSNKEFQFAFESLTAHIKKWCPVLEGLELGFCYVRGDNFGDRTQYVELCLPELLNLNFLNYLQRWLKSDGMNNWRIFVPTYITDAEMIVIYPEKILLGAKYENVKIEDALSKFVKILRKRENKFIDTPDNIKGILKPIISEG